MLAITIISFSSAVIGAASAYIGGSQEVCLHTSPLPPMLEIRNLPHEDAGRTVLSVASWSVPKGEASLIIGPSGSGKSTLIAIIAGLLLPSAGEVRVGESEITRLTGVQRDRYRARHIGLAPQT